MQFETDPTESHKYGVVFEADGDEPEVIGAMTRERIFVNAGEGMLNTIEDHEFDLSKWTSRQNQTLNCNLPLKVAEKLEWFHGRTTEAIDDIVMRSAEPPFDNDDITRRLELGEKALLMAGMIRAEYDSESMYRMLDEKGVDLFTAPGKSLEPKSEKLTGDYAGEPGEG